MARRRRGILPSSGSGNLPERIKPQIEKRNGDYAEKHLAGRFNRIDIRFKDEFCYTGAYTESSVAEGWPPSDWGESCEETIARTGATFTHLCLPRYFGDADRWGFGLYTYSNERYELAMFPTGFRRHS